MQCGKSVVVSDSGKIVVLFWIGMGDVGGGRFERWEM